MLKDEECGMISRERVIRTLEFSEPDRIPRDLWLSMWTENRRTDEANHILEKYPVDFDYGLIL